MNFSLPGSSVPALQLLNLFSGAYEPCILKPTHPKAYALQQQKQWEARALQLESRPRSPKLEKSPHSSEDPAEPKKKKENLKTIKQKQCCNKFNKDFKNCPYQGKIKTPGDTCAHWSMEATSSPRWLHTGITWAA